MTAKAISYKVGMLVELPARPQWGVGKVVGVDDDRLHVYFKNDLEKRAKTFMRAVAPLTLAAEQSDNVLDALPKASQQANGDFELPRGFEKTMAKAAKKNAAE